MRNLKLALVAFVWIISNCRCNSQTNIKKDEGEDFVKKFYIIYNTEWNTDSGFVLKKKLDSLQDKYCTERLVKKIRQPDLDHDLLTNDVGTDMDFAKTINVKSDSTKDNTYIVSYTAHTVDRYSKKEYKEPVVINVRLIKVNGSYKIDNIW
jgi:hypothetical protein